MPLYTSGASWSTSGGIRSLWLIAYGVRLGTGRPWVRSPLWESSLDLLQRHQVLVLGPGNGLESVSISIRLSIQSRYNKQVLTIKWAIYIDFLAVGLFGNGRF